jgi:hypothetical protein
MIKAMGSYSIETVEKAEKECFCHSVLDTESIKNQDVMDSGPHFHGDDIP